MGVVTQEAPDTARGVADLLASAAEQRQSVVPVGGGAHLGIGNPPSRADVLLSTRNLDRVLVHEPADMTLSVEAGATLHQVQEVLAVHGQALPIEVPDPQHATIGGILASAMYGPKRLGWGTLRDYLIGIAAAYPDGSLAKAGGLVVKNVSGFDLMRMHHGALGTLGVIVSANFKVLPAPRSERTVVIRHLESLDDLEAVRTAALRWRGRPVAFEVVAEEGTHLVAIRIDGRARTAELLATELANRLPCASSQLDPDESRAYWSDYLATFDASDSPERWWIRSRVLPAETLGLYAQLAKTGFLAADNVISASPGLGYVDVRGRSGANLAQVLGRLRAIAPRTSVVAVRPEDRHSMDVWGDAVESVELMRQLKQEFDPGHVLNPGRFVGGL